MVSTREAVNAQPYQVFPGTQCAKTLTRRTIVFFRAALIAIAFHAHCRVAIALQIIRHVVELGLFARLDGRLVIFKMNRLRLERRSIFSPDSDDSYADSAYGQVLLRIAKSLL